MRGLAVFTAAVCCVLWAATSSSDVGTGTGAGSVLVGTGQPAQPEPTTQAPAVSAPGSESVQKNPFAPYDIGPPEAIWDYSMLSPDERTYVDRNRDTTGWDGIANTYAAATVQTTQQSIAESASHQLGLETPNVGVVP